MKNLPRSAYLAIAGFGLVVIWTSGYTSQPFLTALLGSICFGFGVWFAAPRQ